MSHHPQPRIAGRQPLASIIGVPHRHIKFVVSNDAFTRILPVNQVGEVCIGGPQVGRGYVGLFHIFTRSYHILRANRYRGREDLTASRFATYPELGESLYRTGDRGKLLADGSVPLVVWIDREVKVRGKNHVEGI
jgi:non-ribosomal peptide synthetase component F